MAHDTPISRGRNGATIPARSDLIEALTFVQAAKKWLDAPESITEAGFDPIGSAVLMLDRAEEFLTAAVGD